jgi:hypothetical protein
LYHKNFRISPREFLSADCFAAAGRIQCRFLGAPIKNVENPLHREPIMLSFRGKFGPGRKPLAVFFAVLLLGTLAAPVRGDEDLKKLDCSLSLIPEDAAFYNTLLRNREQIEAVVNSKAWAKLRELPGLQMGLKAAESELHKPDNPLAHFLQFFHEPANRQLLELLADMGSQEIFFYGGESFVGFVDLAMQLSGGMRFGPGLMMLSGEGRNRDPRQLQALALLNILSANLESLKVPDLVIGFSLSNRQRAEEQLQRLEKLAKDLLDKTPLKGRFQRTQVEGSSFLTLTLDGSLVPWDQIPFKDLEEKEGEFDKLKKKLSQLKLTVNLGVRDKYLLLAIGESAAQIAKLGKGKSLAERAELKPLAKFTDRKINSITYTSKALNAAVQPSGKDVDGWVELANQGLSGLGLPEDKLSKIKKDLEALAKDVKPLLPAPGAGFSFSFLTNRGQESYGYDWGEHRNVESAKPLTILDHLGGSPFFAAAGRSKYTPENYQTLVKWIKVAYGYFEEIGLPQIPADDRQQFQQLAEAAKPILRRLDEATAKLLLPALADGQHGFVLDAKITSKQWLTVMPAQEKDLPMLEPALIVGVSDAEKLRQAFGEYRTAINELLGKLHDLNLIPFEFQIPEPEKQNLTVKSGVSYFYPLPAGIPIDAQIIPNAGLSDSFLVLTISQAHSNRLLTKTPLKVDGGPLADTQRPLASALYCDWPAFVDALTPWIEMGARLAGPQLGVAEEGDDKKLDEILKQVRTVLDVLKCLRGYSSCSYLENGVLVTHGEVVVRDLVK